jgi:hypothetical protein
MKSLCSSDINGFYDCMLYNSPALIKCDSSQWELWHLFYSHSPEGNFSPHQFSAKYGDKIIPVHTDRSGNTENMSIHEFVERISLGEELYAKDWHFFQIPNTNHMYEIPSLFNDDWLNAYWQRVKGGAGDYRFLYIGGKGSVTNVHHDVLYSYSWSLNLHGIKLLCYLVLSSSHL